MKRLLMAATLIAALCAVAMHADSRAETGSDARARELIRLLNLRVLPKESGYLGVIGRSAQMVSIDGRSLAVQSQNYYMLTRDRPMNYLHRPVPDDTHILIEGGPVDYFIFSSRWPRRKGDSGDGPRRGPAPRGRGAGRLLALRLRDGASYALMANTLSPEFTPDRVQIGAGAAWVKRYTGAAPWASAQVLRELIGPNWIAK
jgi:predicted cupin superfamily sugar epimerase